MTSTRLLALACFLFAAALAVADIQLGSAIAPAGAFPSHKSQYGKGGLIEFATSNDMVALPANQRVAGMLASVVDGAKIYTLGSDLTTWGEVNIVPATVDHSTTSSFATNAGNASFATNAGNSTTSGFSTNAGNASFATNAGNATTSGFSTNAGNASFATNAGTAAVASDFTNWVKSTQAVYLPGTTGTVVDAMAQNQVIMYLTNDITMLSPTNAAAGRKLQWTLIASGADRKVVWPAASFKIPSSSSMTITNTVTNGTESIFVIEYRTNIPNWRLETYVWGY